MLHEAWLSSRPADIGWSVLDLEENRQQALEGALRPDAVLADGAIVLLGPWGTSEHSPQAAFLAPLWP